MSRKELKPSFFPRSISTLSSRERSRSDEAVSKHPAKPISLSSFSSSSQITRKQCSQNELAQLLAEMLPEKDS